MGRPVPRFFWGPSPLPLSISLVVVAKVDFHVTWADGLHCNFGSKILTLTNEGFQRHFEKMGGLDTNQK